MSRALATTLASILCSVYAACGSGSPGGVASRDGERQSGTPAGGGAPPRAPGAPFVPSGCVRGGSTPAEVRAAMGEPDSIVGGWWIYGRAQIQFGYGTVQDVIDGADLPWCEPTRP